MLWMVSYIDIVYMGMKKHVLVLLNEHKFTSVLRHKRFIYNATLDCAYVYTGRIPRESKQLFC